MFRDLDDIVPSLGELSWLELDDELVDGAEAVRKNEVLASRLGWDAHLVGIRDLLGLPPSASPESFARAVERWQGVVGLTADGILGPNTWEAMKGSLGLTGSTEHASGSSIDYPVDPAKPYGSKWGAQPPPGLPLQARRASVAGAAFPHIERLATASGLGPVFVRTVLAIAKHESGGRFALPAIRFDGHRGPTAWGAFQFNKGAWQSIPGVNTRYPWESSAHEELALPLKMYGLRWGMIRKAGGSDVAAARGIAMWHQSPYKYFYPYRDYGKQHGFDAAWTMIQPKMSDAGKRNVTKILAWADAGVGVHTPGHAPQGPTAPAPAAVDLPSWSPGGGGRERTRMLETLVAVARQEHARWNLGKLPEADAKAEPYLREYWASIGVRYPGSETPWSAAFVSHCVRRAQLQAGLDQAAFTGSSAHAKYVWYGYRDRTSNRRQRYWTFRPEEVAVEPGDIVVKTRGIPRAEGWKKATMSTYSPYQSHGDIVVEVDPRTRKVLVIGGNVGNTVGTKSYGLTANGTIDTSGNQVFAVLKLA